MVMPECLKFAGMEVNQHSGETLALNVPAEHIHSSQKESSMQQHT
jgi:hypothetical protein